MDKLTSLCRDEYPRLVGILGLYCGDRDLAEDFAQEALVRLCRDWRKVRKLDMPERWLHRVAINIAHSHYRRRGIEQRAMSLLGHGQSKEARIDSDVEALALLGSLPHRQKTALILHYYLDLTVREVADVMQTPEGTVKTLIHRATGRLRRDGTLAEVQDAI